MLLGSVFGVLQIIKLAGRLAFEGCGDVRRRKSPADGFLVGRVHQGGVRQPDLDQDHAFAGLSRKQIIQLLHALGGQAAGGGEVLSQRPEKDFGEASAFFGGRLHHAGLDPLRDCQRKQSHRDSYRCGRRQNKFASKRSSPGADLARPPNHCFVSLRKARNSV